MSRGFLYCELGSSIGTECPLGYFCPAGSAVPTPCPKGTYGASKNLTSQLECTLCDPGSFCDGLAMTLPRGQCNAGYICIEGADTAAPIEDSLNINGQPMGGPCPAGGYCDTGSYEAEPCPQGTYQNTTGSRTVDDCIACPIGYYCAGEAQPGVTGPCDAGFYCTGKAYTPQQFAAPAGYFTGVGYSAPEACDIGYYTPGPNYTECLSCPAGAYCPEQATDEYIGCPAGAYCEEGSYSYTLCPAGTYSNVTNLESLSQCIPCPEGQYCDTNGLTEPTGDCASASYSKL